VILCFFVFYFCCFYHFSFIFHLFFQPLYRVQARHLIKVFARKKTGGESQIRKCELRKKRHRRESSYASGAHWLWVLQSPALSPYGSILRASSFFSAWSMNHYREVRIEKQPSSITEHTNRTQAKKTFSRPKKTESKAKSERVQK
jgi:hypothetical protein